jgi:hypothetical protein
MKLKFLAASVVLALSSSVQAADYYFGDVTNLSVSPIDAFLDAALTTQYTSSYMFTANNISFHDVLHFDVSQTVNGTGTVIEYQFDGKNINSMTVNLYDSNNLFTPLVTFPDFNPSGPSIFSGTGPLASGSYVYVIDGVSGINGGQYTFSASTVAVPEPETWAMLVAGLGLVGLQLRRRTNTGKISIN